MHQILFALVGMSLALSTLAGRGGEPDFKRFGELFLELAPAEAYSQLESWVFAPNKRPRCNLGGLVKISAN